MNSIKGWGIFIWVTYLHLAEHIVQAGQLWLLHWPRPQCLGLVGLAWPWLMRSEWLHYGHALFMLLGLAYFRPWMVGVAGVWWMTSFVLQFYHHGEHALLLLQALFHHNLFGSPVPISLGQLWFPRIELHLFYNLMVFIPMVIALRLKKYA